MTWGKPDSLKFKINSPCSCAKSHAKMYQDGESEGYEIVCTDGSFHVHEYCLYNSEFLYNMLKGLDSTVYPTGRATRYDFLGQLDFCCWILIFLWIQSKARENFKGEGDKKFDLTLFRKDTVRVIFDALHGISNTEARDEYRMKCPDWFVFD